MRKTLVLVMVMAFVLVGGASAFAEGGQVKDPPKQPAGETVVATGDPIIYYEMVGLPAEEVSETSPCSECTAPSTTQIFSVDFGDDCCRRYPHLFDYAGRSSVLNSRSSSSISTSRSFIFNGAW
jgi:hypothetical protein